MSGYALQLSDAEVARYRAMAAQARASEATLWAAAGIGPGARVADVGCGPGAVLLEIADLVGPTGVAVGVDGEPGTVATARALLDAAGHRDVDVLVGRADDTGLPAGSFDVVVMRHVLAHNGPREQAIVDHLATLARPGGHVLLVDIDAVDRFLVYEPTDPDLEDLDERYRAFHRTLGNDLRTGSRLGTLLRTAGLDVVAERPITLSMEMPIGVRPPAFAAADAIVAAGLADADDVARWRTAFERIDAAPTRLAGSLTLHTATARRPG
jgi:SAM-dependent methyltransferase